MIRAVDLVLVLAMLSNFLVLGSGRLSAGIRIVALQGVLLALLPLFIQDGQVQGHLVALSLGMLGLKGILFPWLLFRAIREASMRREMQPLIGFTASLVAGILAAAVAFRVSVRLPLPSAPASSFLIPAALTTILVSFIVLVSRTKALTQVLGYLMLENGIFLFGLVFVREMPVLIELGILLDLFVGVFVMGIVVFHIHREFDHIDTYHLTTLKG
jgi:hydrogenase-4 component E